MKLTTSTANRMVADLTKMPVSKFALMDYNDIQTLIKLISIILEEFINQINEEKN